MPRDGTLDEAEDYLEREREILLSGRIEELERMEMQREAVFSTLARAHDDATRLTRLRTLAERNGALLEASADGIKQAMKRLSDLRKAAGPIGSYSASGGRCEIGSVNPQFERKA